MVFSGARVTRFADDRNRRSGRPPDRVRVGRSHQSEGGIPNGHRGLSLVHPDPWISGDPSGTGCPHRLRVGQCLEHPNGTERHLHTEERGHQLCRVRSNQPGRHRHRRQSRRGSRLTATGYGAGRTGHSDLSRGKSRASTRQSSCPPPEAHWSRAARPMTHPPVQWVRRTLWWAKHPRYRTGRTGKPGSPPPRRR